MLKLSARALSIFSFTFIFISTTSLFAIGSEERELPAECSICFEDFTEAVSTPCGHIYCSGCLKTWREKNNNCPLCLGDLGDSVLIVDPELTQKLSNVLVDCSFKEHGCLSKHAKSDADFHESNCPFRKGNIKNPQGKILARLTEQKIQIMEKLQQYNIAKLDISDDLLPIEIGEYALQQYEIGNQEEAFSMIEVMRPMLQGRTESTVLLLELKALEAQSINKNGIHHIDEAIVLAQKLGLENRLFDLHCTKAMLLSKIAWFDDAHKSITNALLYAFNANPQQRINILLMRGEIAKKQGQYFDARTFYIESLQRIHEQEEAKQNLNKQKPSALRLLGDVYRKEEDHAEAERHYLLALEASLPIFGDQHCESAHIFQSVGMLKKEQAKYQEALQYFVRALSIYKKQLAPTDEKIAILLVSIGDTYREQSSLEMAEMQYEEAMRLFMANQKNTSPLELADLWNGLGLISKKNGRYEEAETRYNNAISCIIEIYPDSYKVGIYQKNLGDVYRKRRLFDEALKSYDDALTNISESLGDEYIEMAEILHSRALVYFERDEVEDINKAFIALKEALDIVSSKFPQHYKTGMILSDLGRVLAMQKNFAQAYEYQNQALTILTSSLGPDHLEVGDSLMALGDLCMKMVNDERKMERLPEAILFYRQAEPIVRGKLGAGHAKYQNLQSNLLIAEQYEALIN